jgi:acetyl esterase/lipase
MVRNLQYGPAKRGHRLDLYVSRRLRRTDAPILVSVHGGGFRRGSNRLGARPLMYRLAAQGWICVSTGYRLSGVRYPDQLADVRAALAWVQANAPEYGGCAERILVAGGSAGAHLAATVALTDPTRVSGAVTLYGFYGNVEQPNAEPASPHAYITAAAPPFLIVHGSLDTLVLAEDARRFADQLRAISQQPVAYAQLPGIQHSFDLFHSLRLHAVGDAIARFAELTTGPATTNPAHRTAMSSPTP